MCILYNQDTQQNNRNFVLFHYVKRNRFIHSYWHGEGVSEMTDNTHKQKIIENVFERTVK